MSIGHSPNIVTNGLSCLFDINNIKSFIGPPVTNDIITFTGLGGDGLTQAFATKGVTVVTNPLDTYKGLETLLWTPGLNYNCYWNDVKINLVSTSTNWTFQTYIRREDRSPITSLGVYLYFPTTGSAFGTLVDCGDGWYLISRSVSGTANTVSLVGLYGLVANVKYYISGPMLHRTAYPMYPIPTNTTRTVNQSMKDIATDTFANVTKLSYDSNALPTFNGTSSSYTITKPLLGTVATPFSLGAWFKTSVLPPIASGIVSFGYFPIITMTATGLIRFWWNDSVGYPGIQTPTTYHNGAYHYACGTYDGTTCRLYVDDVLIGSLISPVNGTNSANIFVGEEHNSGYNYFNGSIPVAQFYNRGLTSAEVLQNYNALKGRFS